MLKNTGAQLGFFRTLAHVYLTVQRDVNRLSCLHISNQGKAENIECNAFRRQHELVAAGCFSLADHERPDTVPIAETDQTVIGDHGNRRVTTPAAPVHALHSVEYIVFRRLEFAPILQLMGKDVQ